MAGTIRQAVGCAWLVAACCLAGPADTAAQTIAEFRLADTRYRFVDLNHTWGNGAVADAFYVGVPGSNEFNLGGGYTIKRGPLALTPLVYFVAAKEGGQRGIKVALLAAFEKDGWKFASFVGDYIPVSGSVTSYQVLDTLDLTHTIGTRVEAGVQAGFFRVDGAWNSQVGPLLKLNDARGAWAVSYRFGSQNEFRVGRVLIF
jgi:hypothetical protein